MANKNSVIVEGIQKYFLLGALILLLALLIIFISPFAIDLLFAGVIVTAVWPLHRRWRDTRFSRSMEALVSLVLITFIVVFPFVLFIFFVSEQAGSAYDVVSAKINVMVADGQQETISKIIAVLPFGDRIQDALAYAPLSPSDLLKTAGDALGNFSSFLLGQTTSVLKHFSVLLVHMFVFLMTMFYLLRDGDRLVAYIYSLVPLSQHYRKELFSKLNHLSYGIIYGIFGAAILQGFLLGIGLAVAGVENAAFWGSIAALFSPVPYLGTTIVWVPIVLSLAFSGHWFVAGLLTLWCALIVGTADNIIKPYLIGSSTALHPMATLFTLLGGMFVFGLKGIFFGPLVLTLTLAFLHIYSLEYAEVLNGRGRKVLKKKAKK